MPKPVAVIANGLQQKQILGGGGERRSVSQQILQAQANTGSTPLIGKPVRLVAVENITLSGNQTVDGETSISNGTRILAAGQSTQAENGVWLYNAAGAWSRASDTIRAGTTYEILEGTDYANRQAVCTNNTDPVIGTDSITFLVRNPVGGSGTAGKLPYWTDTLVLGDSVIEQDSGNIGIGMTPTVKLDVNGTVRSTGLTVDIASAETGRVLTALDSSGAAVWSDLPDTGGGSIGGSGTAGYIPLWSDTTALTDSVIEQSSGKLGIGITSPTAKLHMDDGTNTIKLGADSGAHVQIALGAGKAGIAVTRNLDTTAGMITATCSNGSAQTDAIVGTVAGNGHGVEGVATGAGTGVYGQTSAGYGLYGNAQADGYSLYVSRGYSPATKPVAFFQETSSSPHPVVRIKHLGATKALEVVNNATTVFNILANNNTEILGGLRIGKIAAVNTTPYNVAVDECVINVDSSGGAITINLPSPSAGLMIFVKDVAGSAGSPSKNITVSGNGVNIDGAATFPMVTGYDARVFIANGTQWYSYR